MDLKEEQRKEADFEKEQLAKFHRKQKEDKVAYCRDVLSRRCLGCSEKYCDERR